jgi:hypothetical protein
MKTIELVEAIDLLRKAGWTVELPAKRRTAATRASTSKRVGRPPKKDRRKPGRPRKMKD